MTNKTALLIILALLLGFISAMLLFKQTQKIDSGISMEQEIVIVRDTIVVIKEGRRTHIKTQPIRTLRDTMTIITNPFTISLDTTIARDSIYFKYLYPENQMDLKIISAPDTSYNQYIYIKETEQANYTLTWLERIGIFSDGVVIALLISSK